MSTKSINDSFVQFLIEEKEKSEPFLHQNNQALVSKILSYIGDPDPFVRDDIVYECLAYLTERLSSEEMNNLALQYIGDTYLFFDIKHNEKESAVRRTFTLLQLTVVLYYHNQSNRLHSETVELIAKALISYLEQEKVFLGYDEHLGWIHSLAHSADVLGQLLMSNELTKTLQEDLLDAFIRKLQINHYTYVDEEDERLVTAIEHGLISGKLSMDVVEEFIKKLPLYEKQKDYKHFFTIHINVKSVLRTLYFRLKDTKYAELQGSIMEALAIAKTDKMQKS